jgi:hypothetical protein
VEINDTLADVIDIKWINNTTVVHLIANLKTIVLLLNKLTVEILKQCILVSFEK